MTDILRDLFLLVLLSQTRHINNVVCGELDPEACSGEAAVTSGTVLAATNYSQLLNCGNWSRTISIADGYFMDLTVNSLFIGPDDYLVVSSGSRMALSPSAAILVGRISSARQLRAVRSNTVHLQFFTPATSTLNLEGFTITFSAESPLTTTPKPTDPPSTLPTAPASISDSYTIYLSGRKPVDFLQYKASLKTAIKEMTERYCKANNITVLQNITEQNVVFRYVEQCDVTWAGSADCTKVRLAVPIVVPSGYQLTSSRIRDMWETYASQSGELSLLGLKVYAAPDVQESMYVWLGAMLGVMLTFSIILLVIWKLLNRKSSFKHTSSVTDSHTRMSAASQQSWFDDMPNQELPTNAANGIREYEPDSMHSRVPLATAPPAARPHVPVPDSKPLPEYGATMVFGGSFDKQALIEEDEGLENNVSIS